MAEDSLKDFTINWILTGTLMVCLVAFAIIFMYDNNEGGLGSDTDKIFSNTNSNLTNNLLASSEDSDTLLNITSNTNPEASELGSRDSVATSFKSKASATDYWEGGKNLMSWVFSGTTGKLLISVFSGIIGFLAFFYITKFIRLGT